MDRVYIDTVRLLLETAPHVFQNPLFALKGGTAINLFVRDMPRLSVDLDVVYIDHARDREGTELPACERDGVRLGRGLPGILQGDLGIDLAHGGADLRPPRRVSSLRMSRRSRR